MLNSNYECEDACYQNPTICFDLDFIAKRNGFLQTGTPLKTV